MCKVNKWSEIDRILTIRSTNIGLPLSNYKFDSRIITSIENEIPKFDRQWLETTYFKLCDQYGDLPLDFAVSNSYRPALYVFKNIRNHSIFAVYCEKDLSRKEI